MPPSQTPAQGSGRFLLLSPPSLSSHPEKLNAILGLHARESTDLQMLDRLALGLVSLPESTYDVVLLLTGADNTLAETYRLVSRGVLQGVVNSLKPGGKLRNRDNQIWGSGSDSAAGLGSSDGDGGGGGEKMSSSEQAFRNEAILAGLVFDDRGELAKPDFGAQQAVPLKLGRKKNLGESAFGNGAVELPASNGVRVTTGATSTTTTTAAAAAAAPTTTTTTAINSSTPSGVGFIDFSDDFGVPMVEETQNSDEELIDEEELLGEYDMGRHIVQPPECRPKAGKRRRACKDCTCGLSQKLEAEDRAKRANADKALETLKLRTNDLAEVDFTVQGKVGSCGNCALGDAFRCDGCPYIGLPAFKPGEEVRLLNNDVQL
ncbi:Fe-S cluster assembly protein DRE2 [Paracoccidioides brasiliensis]|uniref:Fe-S cluster assembly protein DRE2 n=1 Tax=Paracoccidioides brasiliensis TaxID=121759 RepID=A0A1D2JCC3_PARBR|nr:Fe-S cluster assembly protein DRE2 [Paracoccidioides brasiliensis]